MEVRDEKDGTVSGLMQAYELEGNRTLFFTANRPIRWLRKGLRQSGRVWI